MTSDEGEAVQSGFQKSSHYQPVEIERCSDFFFFGKIKQTWFALSCIELLCEQQSDRIMGENCEVLKMGGK